MLRRLALPLLLSCLIRPHHTRGLSVNRTIDDELGDVVTGDKPLYSPEGVWNLGTTCIRCRIRPPLLDISQTFDGTWHDATYSAGQPDVEVRANFAGTAVYVYFLVPGTIVNTTTFMNTSFFIDDELVGQFVNTPHAAADISYGVPVYTNVTLANHNHTLLVRATGTDSSLILFDYIIYTVEVDSTSSSPSTSSAVPTGSASPTSSPSHTPVAAIAAGTVGGVLLLAIIAVLSFFLCRRHRRRRYSGRPRSILTEGEAEHRSDDELMNSGDLGYVLTPQSPSFLPPISTTMLYGASRGSADQSQSRDSKYEAHHLRMASPLGPSITRSATVQRQTELMQRIRRLEDQMGGVRSRKLAHAPGDAGDVSGAATMHELQDEIAALRGELAGLRTELADERRLASEALPQYEEDIYRPEY